MTRAPERLALAVFLLCLLAGAVIVANRGPVPDPMVDRESYGAGWRHAVEHQRNPGPSGLSGGRDGTRAACQLWVDQVARSVDRDDFLKGCSDATEVRR